MIPNKEKENNENNLLNNKLDKIINIFSTQLNTVLDGINNLYNFIEDSEVHYILQNMFQSAIDLSKYVNNIKDYKKYFNNSEINFRFTDVNIVELFEDIYSIYFTKLKSFNIEYNINFSNSISSYNYYIDPKYLKQIIINIFDIIITDIETDIINTSNNNILVKIEYLNGYLEFNIYYTSNKNIDTDNIKNDNYDIYYIKYNIINLLVNHLGGDIIYYNELDNMLSFNKHINIKLKAEQKQITEKINEQNKNTITFYILSDNKIYINIIKKALSYFNSKCNIEIIELSNIKIGFNYLKKNISKFTNTKQFIILEAEYNNLFNLNIVNALYKFDKLHFILTTNIETSTINTYIGNEMLSNRIYVYKKPINEHNINQIENFIFSDNNIISL